MKAVYAALFLAACAAVLVIHLHEGESEDVKFEDPFLRTIKQNVVRRAQARLKIRGQKEATQTHIKSARNAMKQALLSAEADTKRTVEAERIKEAKKDAVRTAGKTASKNAPGKKKAKKQFTWDELQKGEDAAKENFTNSKVDSLLGHLKQAPQAAKDALVDVPVNTKSNLLKSALHAARKAVHKEDSDDY